MSFWRALLVICYSWLLVNGSMVLAQDNLSGSPDVYYGALENHFQVTADPVEACVHDNLSDEELPIVLFISQRAGVDVSSVLAVHDGGLNWMQVAWHYHLNPWIFYTPLSKNAVFHTAYEKTYNLYFSKPKKVKLTDAEMEDLLGLKFISEYYGAAPEEVIRHRVQGETFRTINTFYDDKKQMAGWDVVIPGDKPAPSGTPGARPHMGRHHGMMGGNSALPPPSNN